MEKFKLQEWKTAFYPLSIILLFHSHSQRDSSFRACLRKDGIPRYLEIHFHMGIENGSDLPHRKWFLNELRKLVQIISCVKKCRYQTTEDQGLLLDCRIHSITQACLSNLFGWWENGGGKNFPQCKPWSVGQLGHWAFINSGLFFFFICLFSKKKILAILQDLICFSNEKGC